MYALRSGINSFRDDSYRIPACLRVFGVPFEIFSCADAKGMLYVIGL